MTPHSPKERLATIKEKVWKELIKDFPVSKKELEKDGEFIWEEELQDIRDNTEEAINLTYQETLARVKKELKKEIEEIAETFLSGDENPIILKKRILGELQAFVREKL